MLLAERYTLLAPIGRGGMGQVWEARDERLGRTVAVKLLTLELATTGEDTDIRTRRFTREAAVTAELRHPGVPAIYDAGEYDAGLFLVMELVTGYPLGDLIAEHGPLPFPWAATVTAQIAAVLAIAHERGITHRDIKPQNIMLTKDGTVRVLDFGLAALSWQTTGHRLTATGMAVGTPAYMAPEQTHNLPATARTDLYALGCLFYEMLSGGPIFAATSPAALMRMHLDQPPPPLTRADVPPAVAALLWQLVEKDPARRPTSAAEVCDRLFPFLVPPDPLGDVAPSIQPHRHAKVVTRLTTPPPPPPPPAPSLVPSPPLYSYSSPYQASQQVTAVPATTRPSVAWQFRHSLWILPAFFFGMATWMSFGYIGIRHQRPVWLVAAACYLGMLIAGIVLITVNQSPSAFAGTDVAALILWAVTWLGGLAHAIWVNVTVRLPLLQTEAKATLTTS